MTLNITVLTREMIYQSADYRLSVNGRRLDVHSTKATTLNFLDWTGFVTYTGIGRVGNKDTSEFLCDWLADTAAKSFEEVVELIRRNASHWINTVGPGSRHTFIVAAFVAGDPTAAVVSNFQTWHGANMAEISKEFITSRVVATTGPEVIVTGVREAVSRQQRRALCNFANKYATDPARVRRLLATTTRKAGQLHPNLISEDCFVYSQDRYGRGQQESFGNARTVPRDLMHGTDFASITRPFLDKHFGPGKWTVAGSTFTKFGPPTEPPPICTPAVADGILSGYRLVQLARPNGGRAVAHAVNSRGFVVGSAWRSPTGPSSPCVWRNPSSVEFLAHLGGHGGTARDIDEGGMIVGDCQTPDHASHACLWRPDGSIIDTGRTVGRHSAATKLGPSGSIVGWASIHPTDGGQAHFRPAFWPAGGPPVVLRDLGEAWGEGVDINATDQAVIVAHQGRHVDARFWNGDRTAGAGLPSAQFSHFWPKRLADDGTLAGLIIGNDGRRGAAVRRPDGSWEIPVQPLRDREVSAANKRGLIAGYDRHDDYNIPWIMSDPGAVNYLPHLKYHQHRPYMISEDGWIVGTAASDNCCHPLLWIPA